MREANGPYTVELHNLVVVGRPWEPIESSWECSNPFAVQDDAQAVARALALRADGDEEYRVVAADRTVLSTYRVTRRLEVRSPNPGAPDRVEQMDLPPGMEVPMISDVLEQCSHRR